MRDEDIWDLLIKNITENSFKKYKNKEEITAIQIKFIDVESAASFKSHFINLPK